MVVIRDRKTRKEEKEEERSKGDKAENKDEAMIRKKGRYWGRKEEEERKGGNPKCSKSRGGKLLSLLSFTETSNEEEAEELAETEELSCLEVIMTACDTESATPCARPRT